MADKKISELSVATTPLSGSELIPLVQGGVTKRIPASVLVSVGPQGPQGPAGPAGPQGPKGDSAALAPATTTTLGGIKVGSNLTIADDGTLSATGGGGGGGTTPDITVTASVDATSGTPNVTVTKSGPLDAPTFNLAFTGINGAQGAQGPQGPQGPQGDPAVLSAATDTTLGGIKVGSGLAITPDGTLSATGGGGGTAGVSSFNGRTGAVASQSGDYTAEMVGLGNVNNTSDADKPISTATQAALDEKANLADMNTALDAKANTADLAAVATSGDYTDLTNKPVIPAPYSLPKASASELGGVKVGSGLAIDADGVLTATGGGGGGVAGVETFNGRDGTVVPQAGDYTAAMVGLGNVNNTSDADKPVSTAAQAALDLKANTADLSTVATSGSYNDLSNKPTIPSPYTLPVATVSSLGGVRGNGGVKVNHYGNMSVAFNDVQGVLPSSGMTSGSFAGKFLVGNSSATTHWTAMTLAAGSGLSKTESLSSTGGTVTLSGDASWTKSQAIAAPLTGLNTSLTGNITASDTVLSAMGKLSSLAGRYTYAGVVGSATSAYVGGNIYITVYPALKLYIVAGTLATKGRTLGYGSGVKIMDIPAGLPVTGIEFSAITGTTPASVLVSVKNVSGASDNGVYVAYGDGMVDNGAYYWALSYVSGY